jgi:Zn-dependent protease/predicted transcriptional regulator
VRDCSRRRYFRRSIHVFEGSMRWSFTIGRIAGIRVELHVTFLLFIGWIAVSQGVLGGNPARAAGSVLLMLLVFGCVLLHELGHALAARRYGILTRDIVLLPIGGVARLERMPDKPQQEVVVALAGPAVNILIASALLLVMMVLGRPFAFAPPAGGLLETLLLINVAMVLFNLLPAFPMDGGRVLRALLALRLPYVKATRIASLVGQALALLFGIAGLFSNNIMLMFVALFVFLAASEERALVRNRSSMAGLPVRAAMLTQFVVLDQSDPLGRAVELLMSGSQQDFPVMEGDRPVGLLTRADLVRALKSGGAGMPVGQAVQLDGVFAEAGEPLEVAVQRMRERDRPALPVIADGRLAGMLTLENVTELLLVRDALGRYRPEG